MANAFLGTGAFKDYPKVDNSIPDSFKIPTPFVNWLFKLKQITIIISIDHLKEW